MPVKKLVRTGPSPAAQALRDRLVAEWRHPNPAAQQPVILEESGGANQPVHVYVVWDDWPPLGSIERSEVIMDAYRSPPVINLQRPSSTTPNLDVVITPAG